jgi:hypothetical protein
MNTRDLLEIVVNEYKNVKFDKLNLNELLNVMNKLNNVYENRLYRYVLNETNRVIFGINIKYLYIGFYQKYEKEALRYNFLKKETLKLIHRINNALFKRKSYEIQLEDDIYENKPTFTIKEYNFNDNDDNYDVIIRVYENNQDEVNNYLLSNEKYKLN